jgi:uncharacterized membrane protein
VRETAGDLLHAVHDVVGVLSEELGRVAAPVERAAEVGVPRLVDEPRRVVAQVAHRVHDRRQQNRQHPSYQRREPEHQHRRAHPTAPRQAPVHRVDDWRQHRRVEDGEKDQQQHVADRREGPRDGDRGPDEQNRPDRDEDVELAPGGVVLHGTSVTGASVPQAPVGSPVACGQKQAVWLRSPPVISAPRSAPQDRRTGATRTEGRAMESVLAVNFDDDTKAYAALTSLKELDEQHQVELGGAAVVVRREDGSVETKDEIGDPEFVGTASGTLIGLIIGVIGGPLGVLLGGYTGLVLGSVVDLGEADDTESALSDVARSVRPGHPALIAVATEQSPEVVDAAMTSLGGTVARRSLDVVLAEIAAAEDAQRAAEKEARKKLREEREAKAKADVNAKIDELKSKVHRQPAGAGSR